MGAHNVTAGRPPLYTSAEEVQAIIDEYFADCEAREKPYTISGLAYVLDMSTETLRKYADKDEFSATVRKAKLKVERYLEERLDAAACTGAIFNLKNNFGWKDQQDHTVSAALQVTEIRRTVVDPIDGT